MEKYHLFLFVEKPTRMVGTIIVREDPGYPVGEPIDSFSNEGQYTTAEEAARQGEKLLMKWHLNGYRVVKVTGIPFKRQKSTV